MPSPRLVLLRLSEKSASVTWILCLRYLDPITVVAREGWSVAGLWWRSGAREAATQWLCGAVVEGEGKGAGARSMQ